MISNPKLNIDVLQTDKKMKDKYIELLFLYSCVKFIDLCK